MLIKYSYSELSYTVETSSFLQHSYNMLISFLINSKYGIAEVKYTRSLILWTLCSATSYVAATFHPTIGQRAPKPLNNAATPELGMILQGIRELAGWHIAKGNQNIAKPTKLGLSGH